MPLCHPIGQGNPHSTTTRVLPLAALLVLVLQPLSEAAEADDGFIPLFDGRSLEGWETPEPRYWSVEDGAITGRITPEQPCTVNQYLVWKGGDLADFELRLKSRLNGEGGINNGFQFRSRLLPDHDVCGYQVDNNLQTPWLVRLYDEFGRHTLALRGERATFSATGQRIATPLPDATQPAWFRLEDWHEYHLVCRGGRLSLSIDGRLAAQVQDDDPRRAEPQGILALQLHSGPPTLVQFKDIRLKVLRPASPQAASPTPTTALQTLRNEAVAWWPMDTGGHGAQPALHHFPGWDRFELNVLASGPGARPNTKVVTLDGAHFESQPQLPVGGGPMTLYLRVADPKGAWSGTLASRQGPHGSWRLHGPNTANGSEATLVLELTAPSGPRRIHLPIGLHQPTAWHDLVARFNGTSMALFLDGQPIASEPSPVPPTGPGEPLCLAADRETGKAVRHFRGEFETAALWSRALTDAEIQTLSSTTP